MGFYSKATEAPVTLQGGDNADAADAEADGPILVKKVYDCLWDLENHYSV